jgi:hypothetical protein
MKHERGLQGGEVVIGKHPCRRADKNRSFDEDHALRLLQWNSVTSANTRRWIAVSVPDSPISAGDFELAGGREAVAADGFVGVAVREKVMHAIPQARQRLGCDEAQAPRPAGLDVQEKIVAVIHAEKVLVHPRTLPERLGQP